ncbi:MAG: hypothetical protein ACLQMF_01720 [Rectinemataceae bacterium]
MRVMALSDIHESRSSTLRGGTLVVNPGPFSEGYFADLELREGEKGNWHARAELYRI